MQIKELTLKNFRSFRDEITIKNLSDVNIFIGPNNAGKSNILEALRYLNALAFGRGFRNFRELVFDRNENKNIQLTIKFALSPEQRSKIIRGLFKGHSYILSEDVQKSPFLSEVTYNVIVRKDVVIEEEIKITNIAKGDLTVIKHSLEENSLKHRSIDLDTKCKELTKLENISIDLKDRVSRSPAYVILRTDFSAPKADLSLIDMLKGFMNRWYWFGPIRQATPSMPPGEEIKLESSGSNLAKLLNSILSGDPRRFVKLGDEVARILPNIKDILAPLRGGETTVTVREEGLETATDLGNVSFGLMQTLIEVVGFITAEAGSLILIEEPELHLHAGSQRKLFELIRKEAEHKQFFITAHSSIFTGCTEEIKTYLVTKREGATRIKQIEEPTELKLIKTELGHRNTDLYGDECVVFIEGDSEEVAFPVIAEAMGYDLVEKGIRLINIRGSGKAKKIEEYLRYLKDSDVLVYVIADADKVVSKKLDDWIREGLLQKDCVTIWPLEFEDCFDLDLIVKAMNEIAKEQGLKFQITADDLKREEGKSVVKILQQLMYERGLPSLDKTSLSEKLALIVKEDIKKGLLDRKKTIPELEIEKMVKLVEARREVIK